MAEGYHSEVIVDTKIMYEALSQTSNWYFSFSSLCSVLSVSICSFKDCDLSLSAFSSSSTIFSFSAPVVA